MAPPPPLLLRRSSMEMKGDHKRLGWEKEREKEFKSHLAMTQEPLQEGDSPFYSLCQQLGSCVDPGHHLS